MRRSLASYKLDALGRRIQEITGTTRDLFYSDRWQVLEERVNNIRKVQNLWSVTYVDGLTWQEQDLTGDGAMDVRYYVMQDANWNVTGIVDPTGPVLERYVYDVYGSRTVLTGTWAARPATLYQWNIGHQGGRFEILTGNIHWRNRDLRPTIQAWVSMDPVFTSTNWYVAYGNNPVNAVDPTGTDIVFLLASNAADGNGHAAVFIGNEQTGWRYFSFAPKYTVAMCDVWLPYESELTTTTVKSLRNPDKKSLADMLQLPKAKTFTFDFFVYWKTTSTADANAIQHANKWNSKDLKFHVSMPRYGDGSLQLGANCTDMAVATIWSGGVYVTPKTKWTGPGLNFGLFPWQATMPNDTYNANNTSTKVFASGQIDKLWDAVKNASK